MQSPVPPTEELILERLLAGLLERGGRPETDGVGAPPDVLQLRDMARRLRASVQWMPLPRSRLALRRALLATVEAARSRPAARQRERYLPAAWRRTGRWLTAVTAATFLMIGAALGAHALETAVSPSGPLYAIALQIDAMRVELAGDAMHRAAALLDVTRARAAEIGAMAYSDDPRGVEEAATALERQNRWLRSVTRSLPAADQQRFAPAAEMSETLVVAARRAAQLRMGGFLPSGVTMADVLRAVAGPLSGAGTTDVSAPAGGSREGAYGTGGGAAAPGLDTSGSPTEGESGPGISEGGNGGTAGGQSAAGPGTSRSGESTDAGGGASGSGGQGDVSTGASGGAQSASGDSHGSGGGQGTGGTNDIDHNNR